MKEYNKLVRDKIPELIQARGQPCEFHVAAEEEFRQKSIEKVSEEAAEFVRSPTLDELADLREAVDNAAVALGSSAEELEQRRLKKAQERGGFSRRIILERS